MFRSRLRSLFVIGGILSPVLRLLSRSRGRLALVPLLGSALALLVRRLQRRMRTE